MISVLGTGFSFLLQYLSVPKDTIFYVKILYYAVSEAVEYATRFVNWNVRQLSETELAPKNNFFTQHWMTLKQPKL